MVLFGRNVASYKFALAKALLRMADRGDDRVRLDEVAVPFARHLCEHLARVDRQATSRSSRFLDACRAFNRGELPEGRLVEATVRLGFANVIDAFHVVGNGPVPARFFLDERVGNGAPALRLTDDLRRLAASVHGAELPEEAEARWRLVETAWALDLPRAGAMVRADATQGLLYVERARRVDLTGVRPALNGYQRGRCFYCRDAQQPTLCERRRVYGITRRLDSPPHLTGAWADTIYLEDGTTIVRLGDAQPSEAVIALGCAGPTVVHGLLHRMPPRPGEAVVIQGAGPVGLAAAMYAQLAGARPAIVIGAPAQRLELASRLGVGDERLDIDALDIAARAARVRELTGGRGADLVVECTGVPAAVAEGIDLVRPGGRVLVLGQYTDHGPTPINPHLITRKHLSVDGSWAFSAAHYVEYVRTVPLLRERFALEELITAFPLTRAQDALDAARTGNVAKAVVVP